MSTSLLRKTSESAPKEHRISSSNGDRARNQDLRVNRERRELFLQFSQHKWVALQGCAGSGKTTLAVEWIAHVRQPAVFLATSKSGEEKLNAVLGRRPGLAVLLLDDAKDEHIDGKFVVVHDFHRAPELSVGLLDAAHPRHVMLLTQEANPQSICGLGSWEDVWLIHQMTHSYTVASGIVPLANALSKHAEAVPIESTDRVGPRPLLVEFDDGDALSRYVNAEIKELIAEGVAASDVVVICASGAESRQMSSRLLSTRIAASPISRTVHRSALKRVFWLTRLATRLRSGSRLAGVDKRNQQIFMKQIGEEKWKLLLKEVRAIKVTSLESTYCHCCDAYLRARGGVRAHHNQRLRSYLMVWEPVARASRSASELLKLSLSAAPVRCLTPQAARGGAWKYVFIAGLTSGVWSVDRAQTDMSLLRQLLVDSVTRCSRELSVLICPGEAESGFAVLRRIAGEGVLSDMFSYGSMRT